MRVSDRDFKPYLSKEQISARIDEVAEQINHDLKDVERPLFLCVLNGAFIFAADLFRRITLSQAEFTTIRLKSYVGLTTTGDVKMISGLTEPVEGRTVVIIEDIIDSGYTMDRLIHQLLGLGAHQVKVCSLLRKPKAQRVANLQIDYCCFEIPNDFIVGYGLDYNEQGRNLPDIWVVAAD